MRRRTNPVLVDVAIPSLVRFRHTSGKGGPTSLYSLIAFNLNSSVSSLPIAASVEVKLSGMDPTSGVADVDARATLPTLGI